LQLLRHPMLYGPQFVPMIIFPLSLTTRNISARDILRVPVSSFFQYLSLSRQCLRLVTRVRLLFICRTYCIEISLLFFLLPGEGAHLDVRCVFWTVHLGRRVSDTNKTIVDIQKYFCYSRCSSSLSTQDAGPAGSQCVPEEQKKAK
jgi:hypothetical protein